MGAPELDESALRSAARRTARLVALQLLASVRAARDRLDHPGDDEALHDFRVAVRRLRSWLRAFRDVLEDTLSPTHERKLKRVARATGASRDLEVHIAWVEERRKALRGTRRPGADWLLARLRDRKASCDVELRRVVDSTIDRTVQRIGSAMESYLTSVVGTEPTFADVVQDLVTARAAKLENALGRITGLGDRAEAHTARIEAKRLRYLLEPLVEPVPATKPIVQRLTELQDHLGELHDAQVFGSEMASSIAEVLASRAPAGDDTGSATANGDPVPGLIAMSRVLRRTEQQAFAEVEKSWLRRGTPLPRLEGLVRNA